MATVPIQASSDPEVCSRPGIPQTKSAVTARHVRTRPWTKHWNHGTYTNSTQPKPSEILKILDEIWQFNAKYARLVVVGAKQKSCHWK
jgi:hypothetical protein